jgi:hypothetical protein
MQLPHLLERHVCNSYSNHGRTFPKLIELSQSIAPKISLNNSTNLTFFNQTQHQRKRCVG